MAPGRGRQPSHRRGSGCRGMGGRPCVEVGVTLLCRQPKPLQRFGDGLYKGARRQRRTLDQQHRQAQDACGFELGLAPFAARVFGHYPLDAMGAQERQIVLKRVRAALHHYRAALRRHLKPRLHDAQQIPVRRVLQERLHLLAPNGQKDAAWRSRQGTHRGVEIGHAVPAVAGAGTPRRALQRQQRHAKPSASLNGVAAHLCGKRVRGIDHVRDALLAQEGRQPIGAAEAAHASWQRLRNRLRSAPGVGKSRGHASAGECLRQLRGFGGAPEQEDMHGG